MVGAELAEALAMTTPKQIQALSSQILNRRRLPAGSLLAIGMSLCAVASLTGAALIGNQLHAAHDNQGPSVNVIVLNKPPPTATLEAPMPAPAPLLVQAQPKPKPKPEPEPAPAAPAGSEHAVVFNFDGQSYVAIESIQISDVYAEGKLPDDTYPKHGPLRMVGEPHYPDGVIASVDEYALDGDVLAWQNHPLVIAGTCRAEVTGFALISLISGEPDIYGGIEADTDKATRAERFLRFGNTVIAGRLSGCGSDNAIARSASLPAAIAAIAVDDKRAVAAAREQLLGSNLAFQAQRHYEEDGYHEGTPKKWWKAEKDAITSMTFRHPSTGQTLISMQAVVDHGCGGANIFIWGIYEVTAPGEVEQVQLSAPENLMQVQRAIDIDGDGTFEFMGHDASNDPALIRATGEVLTTLETPFYGCPC